MPPKKKNEGIQAQIDLTESVTDKGKKVVQALEEMKKAASGKGEISVEAKLNSTSMESSIKSLASTSAAAIEKSDKAVVKSAQTTIKAAQDTSAALRRANVPASLRPQTPNQVFKNLTDIQASQFDSYRANLVRILGSSLALPKVSSSDLGGINEKLVPVFSSLQASFKRLKALYNVLDLIREKTTIEIPGESVETKSTGGVVRSTEISSGVRRPTGALRVDNAVRGAVLDYNLLSGGGQNLSLKGASLETLRGTASRLLVAIGASFAQELSRATLRFAIDSGAFPVDKALGANLPNRKLDQFLSGFRQSGVLSALTGLLGGTVTREDFEEFLKEGLKQRHRIGSTNRRIGSVKSTVPSTFDEATEYVVTVSPKGGPRQIVLGGDPNVTAPVNTPAPSRSIRYLPAGATLPVPVGPLTQLTGRFSAQEQLEKLEAERVAREAEARKLIGVPVKRQGDPTTSAPQRQEGESYAAYRARLRGRPIDGGLNEKGFINFGLMSRIAFPPLLIIDGVKKLVSFLRGMGEIGAANVGSGPFSGGPAGKGWTSNLGGITPQQVALARSRLGGGSGAPPPSGGGPNGPDPDDLVPRGRRFGSAFSGLITYVTAATAVYTILGSFQNAISQAVTFEEKLAQLRGLLPARGLSDLLLIQDSVIENSSKYGQSVSEVVEVAQALVQTGRSAVQVVKDLDQIIGAATGLNLPLNSAQELVIAIRSLTLDLSTGTSRIDTDVFDKIAVAQQKAAVSSYDLAEAIKTIAPTAIALRGQFVGLTDEVDVVLASIGKIVQGTGTPGSQAATSLRNTLARISRPEVIKALENIGGAKLGTIESGGTELRPLREIIGELSRVYSQLGSVDRQRLLTQVAGSRQTNALEVLLKNFNEVQDNAERSALAFGAAQQRTGLILETTRNKINQVSTSLQGIGLAFLQSEFAGGAFRTVLTGIASALRFVGKDAEFVIPKFALLIGGILAVTRVAKVLGTATLFSFGRRTTEELALATASFGKFGTVIQSAAIKIGAKLQGNVLFGGLLTAIGPGGVIALTIAAIAGITFAIIKLTQATDKYKSLRSTFLTSEQAAETFAPKIQQFEVKAKEYGIDPAELVQGVRTSAEKAFPALEQLAGGKDKLGSLTRSQIFQTVFPILTENIDGFDKAIRKATEGMKPAEAEARKLEIVMDLLGEAAYFRSGVLQVNYNARVQEAEALRKKFVEVFDDIAKSSERVLLFAPITSSNRGIAAIRFGPQQVLEQIAKQASGVDEQVGALFRLILESGKSTGVLDEATDKFGKALKTISGNSIEAKEALSEFAKQVNLTVDATERTKLVEDIAKRFDTFLPSNFDITRRLVGITGQSPDAPSSVFGSILADASVLQQKNILTRLGGDSELRLIRLFERSGQGVRVVLNDMNKIVVGVKNPLTEFIQDLFFTTQGLIRAEEAARDFGLSLESLSGDRVTALEQLGQKLARLDLDSFKQLADAEQELEEANIVETKLSKIRVPRDPDSEFARNLDSEKQNIQNTITRLTARVALLRKFAGDLGVEGQETINSLRSLVANDPTKSAELEKLLANVASNSALSKDEKVAESLRLTEEFLKDNLDESRQALKLYLEKVSSLDTGKIGRIGRANAADEISGTRLQQGFETKSFGLSPIESLGSSLDLINKQRERSIRLAEELFKIDMEELEATRIRTGETPSIRKLVELEGTKQRAIQEANITAEKRAQLEIDKAIHDQNQEILKQTQDNITARLSGVREVLTNFDKLRKGSLSTILQPAGKNFIDRQADVLLSAFKSGGPLSKIGDVLGGAGEQEKIVAAHSTGTAILVRGIVQAHTAGAQMIAAASGRSLGGVSAVDAGFADIAYANSLGVNYDDLARIGNAGSGNVFTPDAKRLRAAQIAQSIGSVGGYIGGSAAGGGGSGAQTGASIGALAGLAIPIPVVGPLVGGIVGGLIGGLFDKNKNEAPAVTTLEKISRSSEEQVTLLENTNRLLEAQNLAFNVPSTFRLPQYGAQLFAGQASVNNEIVVNVSVGGSNVSSQELGRAVSEAVAVRLQKEYNAGGSYTTRTSY